MIFARRCALMTTENYVYKKEVDWSLLQEGLTLPFDNQVVFGQITIKFRIWIKYLMLNLI